MKFKEKDILYYVNPFVFTIEKVKVDMGLKERGEIFYIDQSGAYLQERDLFANLNDAKQDALKKLDNFYHIKRMEILNNKPKYSEDM